MPDLHRSARKHYRRDQLDDEDDPRRWLLIAVDSAGRLLDLVVMVYDDSYELIIHAMKARAQYLEEL